MKTVENRKARHLFELSSFVEAGIVLIGSEVKSIRAGRANFTDSYVSFSEGEAWLHSLDITGTNGMETDPLRIKKLLLSRGEIDKFATQVAQKGFTVVPTKLYLKNGKMKVEIALAKGRNLHDHRERLKEKAIKRDNLHE